jgi:hypothetical protein
MVRALLQFFFLLFHLDGPLHHYFWLLGLDLHFGLLQSCMMHMLK